MTRPTKRPRPELGQPGPACAGCGKPSAPGLLAGVLVLVCTTCGRVDEPDGSDRG